MSYRTLLQYKVDGEFKPEPQRFASKGEAEECGKVGLARNWQVLDWKVEESPDPVNSKWNFYRSISERFQLNEGGTK